MSVQGASRAAQSVHAGHKATVHAHRNDPIPLGVLVVHLDQNGILGVRSTVARGSRGLCVRHLHLACERKVACDRSRAVAVWGSQEVSSLGHGSALPEEVSGKANTTRTKTRRAKVVTIQERNRIRAENVYCGRYSLLSRGKEGVAKKALLWPPRRGGVAKKALTVSELPLRG